MFLRYIAIRKNIADFYKLENREKGRGYIENHKSFVEKNFLFYHFDNNCSNISIDFKEFHFSFLSLPSFQTKPVSYPMTFFNIVVYTILTNTPLIYFSSNQYLFASFIFPHLNLTKVLTLFFIFNFSKFSFLKYLDFFPSILVFPYIFHYTSEILLSCCLCISLYLLIISSSKFTLMVKL